MRGLTIQTRYHRRWLRHLGIHHHSLQHQKAHRDNCQSNPQHHRRQHRFVLDRNHFDRLRSCTLLRFLDKGQGSSLKRCPRSHLDHNLPIGLGFLQGLLVRTNHGTHHHRPNNQGNRCTRCHFQLGTGLRFHPLDCRHNRHHLGQTTVLHQSGMHPLFGFHEDQKLRLGCRCTSLCSHRHQGPVPMLFHRCTR